MFFSLVLLEQMASFSRTMVIFCEAWNTRTKNMIDFRLLSPGDEDDASNEQQDPASTVATIDGKERSTWQATAGNAEDDDIKQLLPMPPPNETSDDVVDFKKVIRFCRPEPSVELLAVYPHFFPFVGKIAVDENGGQFVYHQEEGENPKLDSEENLVLTGPFETISGFGSGCMTIEIPEISRPGVIDTATLVFGDYPCVDAKHEDRLITTKYGRHLVVSYVLMKEGLGVHVQEEKVQLTPSAGNGSVILKPMQRFIVTVPINPQPFLTIKVRLNVTTPSNEGVPIPFEGDVEFPLDRDHRIRTISTNHGEVKVSITYN
ncbi:uncharacterized protein LOC125543361 isoform X4 [Triticum urartu]|uniref:uncharacterized protein LOC125543361 isoform X4 n=1 Tax=Triticum urartu TaxID=4572 RepID=UPI0020443CC6|nr:uncharacterized protein LOC125543361 isoform X4 [Triticum urartu]